MNKSDLVESIAYSAQITKNAAERGLNGLLTTLSVAMQEGKRVTLSGFGSFSVVDRAPRIGRNLKTGEKVPIPQRRIVKFRPCKELSVKVE